MIIGIIAVLAAIALYIIMVYNNLVRGKNIVENATAQVDTQLKRRFDLIPNLVDCVKMYMQHEKDTLSKITEIRAALREDSTIEEKGEVLRNLNKTLKNVMVSVEAYPELKANENFGKLQDELKVTEDKIAFARQFYNDSVTRFNNLILVFPNNIVANILGFKQMKYFEIEDNERTNVSVKMD